MANKRVRMRVSWGNGDAGSEIVVRRSQWIAICRGEAVLRTAKGWYEGKSFSIYWSFEDRQLHVTNDEGGDCVFCGLDSIGVCDAETGEPEPILSRQAAENVKVRRRPIVPPHPPGKGT